MCRLVGPTPRGPETAPLPSQTVGALAEREADVEHLLTQAEALGVPAWVGSHIKQLLAYSISQGYGDKASVTMIQHWEKWAGVEVKSKDS